MITVGVKIRVVEHVVGSSAVVSMEKVVVLFVFRLKKIMKQINKTNQNYDIIVKNLYEIKNNLKNMNE